VSRRLRSNRLAELITRLRADFDVTLIDTPDLSANTVAWILGRQTDGIVLVFGPDQTQEAQDFARARLAETDTPVLGTIVNQPSRSPVPA
jgi:Mrp family chromosome partitioning ATPase